MLEVSNLEVSPDGEAILKNLNFRAVSGSFHVIMGPNGSGKSTLARTLAGHPEYENYRGSINFKGRELSTLSPEERLLQGLMLGFQHPPKIEGVGIRKFLKQVLEKLSGFATDEAKEQAIKEAVRAVDFPESILDRNINDGLSGGERKRLELLQASLIEPDLLILDEPDSGVDVDSLNLILRGINSLHDTGTAIVLITHYGNLLKKFQGVKMKVHLVKDGRIVTSGNQKLVREVEEKGFNRIYEECGCN